MQGGLLPVDVMSFKKAKVAYICDDLVAKYIYHTKAQRHEERDIENIHVFLRDLRELRERTTFYEYITDRCMHIAVDAIGLTAQQLVGQETKKGEIMETAFPHSNNAL